MWTAVNLVTFILKALLKPDAKKPPNGAISDAKMDKGMECIITGYV